MAMGIQEVPEGAPDTYGLPEYKISEMRTEIDGHDVRMVFGVRKFGQIQWLYTVVASPENLMSLCRECQAVAEQAFNLSQMMDRRGKGH